MNVKNNLFAGICLVVLFLISGVDISYAQNLRDASGRSLGRIEADGTIRDSSGRATGRIDNDGTVRDASGRILGRIDRYGLIRDEAGRMMGSATGVPTHSAAVLFWFR